MFKKVIADENRTTRTLDELVDRRIYACRFGCNDIAIATRIHEREWTWVSAIHAYNPRRGSTRCDTLKSLLSHVICGRPFEHEVLEFEDAKEFASWILEQKID